MSRAQSLDDAIATANGAHDVKLASRLELARRIRDYASRELKLPDNGSYRRYANLHRPYVVWSVFATPELSMELRKWCFPIVGCITYRGYYDQNDAQVDRCYLTDPLCRAVCVCKQNRAGKSCHLTAFEGKQLTSLRESLCSSLYRTLGMHDVTSDVVRARALTVRDLTADVSQISTAALSDCTAALVATVSDARPAQINLLHNSSVTNTRGLHVDNLDGNYKAFLYLGDVRAEDGPYAYVPGSHRRTDLLRREARLNSLLGHSETDSHAFEDLALSFPVPKGTLIVSCQSGVHRGLPQMPGASRNVLVANFRR